MSKSSGEFFNFIHTLRGFSVLLVVWSHLGGWWLSSRDLTDPIQTYWENIFVKPLHLDQNGGHLGVLIFFLISGFIITHVSLSESVKEFAIKRLFRIFPAVLVALLITYIVVFVSESFGIDFPLGTGVSSLKEYFYSLLLINYIIGVKPVMGVTWTLFIEMVFYIVTAILSTMTKRDPVKATYYFCFIISIIVMFSSLSPYIRSAANLSVYVLFLLVGRSFYLGRHKIISQASSASLCATCLLLYIFFYSYLYPNTLFSSSGYSYPVIYSDILAIMIFVFASSILNNKSKLNFFLANISYSMYLIHLPIGGLTLVICNNHGFSFVTSFSLAILACVISSYIILKAVEKPSQNLARKIINKLNN